MAIFQNGIATPAVPRGLLCKAKNVHVEDDLLHLGQHEGLYDHFNTVDLREYANELPVLVHHRRIRDASLQLRCHYVCYRITQGKDADIGLQDVACLK